MGTFEYVVVGGGTAGCVLANRLSEDRAASVLLVEAGRRDNSPFIRVPVGMLQIRARDAWQYAGEPDPTCPGFASRWLGGKVLGGSSSVNGGVWTRGDPSDFDGWAELGCKGWDYESVLPYFKRTETFAGGGDRWRGGDGPLHVCFNGVKHPLTDAFIEAAQQVGIPYNEDLNGESQEGVGYSQVNQRHGWRDSTARAYLAPARRRRNLSVATNALVTRILFTGDRASGVEYRAKDGSVTQVTARRGVIVSAGAIESPKLLQLSGIGDGDELRSLGIDVVHDNPAVGQNLQEHVGIGFGFRPNVPTLNLELNALGVVRHGFDFVMRGKGAATAPPTHAFVFGKVDDDSTQQDYEFMFMPFGMTVSPNPRGPARLHGAAVPMKEPYLGMSVLSCHPKGRGSVTLRSSSPDDPPIVRHELLSDADIAVLTTAARRAREVVAVPSFQSFIVEELHPGPDVDSDDEWEAYARRSARGGHHPIGTCKMGNDPDAVVDPELSVHGVEGLRVVDASVMPSLISGHTNAATVMVAERAADIIRGM